MTITLTLPICNSAVNLIYTTWCSTFREFSLDEHLNKLVSLLRVCITSFE